MVAMQTNDIAQLCGVAVTCSWMADKLIAFIEARIEELGITPTELGRRMGYSNGYQGYHDLLVGKRVKLTPKKLASLAGALEVPVSSLERPDEAKLRDAQVKRVLDEFLRTPYGASVAPSTKQTLASMRFLGERLPTVALYRFVALLLEEQYTVPQLTDAMELERTDREAEAKLPKYSKGHGKRAR